MCHKLLQIYHCGDIKVVCTTPCPHALRTATPLVLNSSEILDTASSTPRARTMSTSTTHSDSTPAPHSEHQSVLPTTPTTSPPAYQPGSSSQTESERTPNLCPHFFVRRLPRSTHPCLCCYMKPQYEAYRKRYMDHYRGEHPGQNFEHIEELTGLEHVAETLGIVNVAKEMEKLAKQGYRYEKREE